MNEKKMQDKAGRLTSRKPPFFRVLQKSALSFAAMAPMIAAVVGLVGLFQILVTPQMLAALFRGNVITDTLTGTLAGAAAVGTPIISYLLGGELLGQGISLFAVTAFILSWVSLGLIQLPAEVEAFGGRFTLYRNLLAFAFTIIVAVLTPLTLLLIP
jgi:hypothetical protein